MLLPVSALSGGAVVDVGVGGAVVEAARVNLQNRRDRASKEKKTEKFYNQNLTKPTKGTTCGSAAHSRVYEPPLVS